jgi:hypothetical protein
VTSEAVASRRRARLRKNLKIAERKARRIQASNHRKATVRKSTKKVAEQWVQLTPNYDYFDDVEGAHGRAVKGWAPTDNTIEGNVYQREDGTYGFFDYSSDTASDYVGDYAIEKNGYKTLNEAKNGLLRSLDLAPVSSHASRMSSVDMKAARKAALAAARKKAAAKTPSIVQRSAAAVKPGFELI